ncbi:MAG: sugar phosphorylase [Trueperaceae bacterium]
MTRSDPAPRTTAATPRIHGHLARLYGEALADAWTPRLAERLAATERRFPGPPTPPAERLGPEASVLITYADQVRAAGEAPLRTLKRLLDGPLAGTTEAVHLLPFYPSTSDDGFSVAAYDAVDPTVGTWDDVAALARDRRLMFDAVINHASASHPWFQSFLAGDPAFAGWFVTADLATDLSATVRPRTTPLLTPFDAADGVRHVWSTFSADQVDLDYRRPEVLAAVLDVLLGYVERGARLLRLDAVTYLWKAPGTSCANLPQTHEVLKLVRTALEAATPGVVMVTETNVPHAQNVGYFGNGHDEAQMVYNFALPPLALHAFALGDARVLRDWATELRTPSPEATFFNFLASHDGIGVRPVEGILPRAAIDALAARVQGRGGRVSRKADVGGGESPYELNVSLFDALADPGRSEADGVRRMLCAHALMLALPGVPGVYVHSLLGSRNDSVALAATGRARSINRGRFAWDELVAELADPRGRRRQVLDGLRHLLRTRAAHPAFHPAAPQRWPEAPANVAAIVRSTPTHDVVCLHHVGGPACSVDAARLLGRRWPMGARDLVRGEGVPDAHVALAAHEVRWIEVPRT